MSATAEQLPIQTPGEFNQERRIRTDTATWAAEALHGSMRTSFEYVYVGQELYGEDGGAIGDIFSDAINSAKEMVAWRPDLAFELRRRIVEYGEYEDMLAMADGKLPNTMVVVSDFPPELMNASRDEGGYNAGRKQTMLRVITRDERGVIRVTTQSLDQSNRQGLETIFSALGKEARAGELLEQRLHLDLPPQWQKRLIDNLTEIYDSSLQAQYGGAWHAGIKQTTHQSIQDTYGFARAQQDLIDWFTEAKLQDPPAAEKLRYKLAATMRERYHQHLSGTVVAVHQTVVMGGLGQRLFHNRLYHEIEAATRKAVGQRRTFSGCGASVGPEGEVEDRLAASGYGNKADQDCEFISRECPKCHTKNIKTRVTKHRISGSCGCSVAR